MRYFPLLLCLFALLTGCAMGVEADAPSNGKTVIDPIDCPTSCKIHQRLHIQPGFSQHELDMMQVGWNALNEGTGGRWCEDDSSVNSWEVIRLNSGLELVNYGYTYDPDTALNILGLTDYATKNIFLMVGHLTDITLPIVTVHETLHSIGESHSPPEVQSIMRAWVDPTSLPDDHMLPYDRIQFCTKYRIICTCTE